MPRDNAAELALLDSKPFPVSYSHPHLLSLRSLRSHLSPSSQNPLAMPLSGQNNLLGVVVRSIHGVESRVDVSVVLLESLEGFLRRSFQDVALVDAGGWSSRARLLGGRAC